MKVADFNYDLSENKIAYKPPEQRGGSKLLVLGRTDGKITDRNYKNLPDFLKAGDVLVLNDTRVMKARIIAKKTNGKEHELVVLERHGGDDFRKHEVLYRGHLKKGDQLYVNDNELIVEEPLGQGRAIINSDIGLIELSEKVGVPPLPPYIKRQATADDIVRYQTIFAREMGSAAAPTASLNMTEKVLAQCKAKGIKICYLTLHVGLGTFLPIRTDIVEDHHMHSEYFTIPESTLHEISSAKQEGRRIISVGTTVARTLEYWGQTGKTSGEDDIFIYPGYQWNTVDVLLTNFHAPGSTVLMMAAAFAGWDNLRVAYEHALTNNYEFLSYGDSMLII